MHTGPGTSTSWKYGSQSARKRWLSASTWHMSRILIFPSSPFSRSTGFLEMEPTQQILVVSFWLYVERFQNIDCRTAARSCKKAQGPRTAQRRLENRSHRKTPTAIPTLPHAHPCHSHRTLAELGLQAARAVATDVGCSAPLSRGMKQRHARADKLQTESRPRCTQLALSDSQSLPKMIVWICLSLPLGNITFDCSCRTQQQGVRVRMSTSRESELFRILVQRLVIDPQCHQFSHCRGTVFLTIRRF